MKIVICIIVLSLSACASVSEYNQGCRDGIRSVTDTFENVKDVNGYCDKLDKTHSQSNRVMLERNFR